jgi:uncharacterized membrane protein YhaH (DUF805 family)
MIVSIVISVLQNTFKSMGSETAVMAIGAINGLYSLGLLIPNLAVGVRRFHDIGRTGWWIIFPSVITLIAAVIYFSLNGAQFVNDIQSLSGLSGKTNMPPAQIFAILGALAKPFLWIFLPAWLASLVTFVFHVTDGTPGPNRFGDDPKGRGNANVF